MLSSPRERFPLVQKHLHVWILILVLSSSLLSAVAAEQPQKEVRSEADLPRTVYAIDGSVGRLLQAENAAFAPLLEKAVADIHSLLTDYDIKDRATLISVLSAKLATQELKGETGEALQTIGALRALLQKPDLKLTVGLFDEALLRAQQITRPSRGPAYEHEVELIYKDAVSTLPWDVVQDTVKSARNTSALLTEAFLCMELTLLGSRSRETRQRGLSYFASMTV